MIELIRDGKSEKGTHGTFELGGETWHSLEQPDLGNEPFISCVPQGKYSLVPWDSKKYGPCFVMVNEDLNVYHSKNSPGRPSDGRYKCLFVHRGNYVRSFQGCIGASHGYNEVDDMLLSSTRNACIEVNRLVNEEGSFKLRISHEIE